MRDSILELLNQTGFIKSNELMKKYGWKITNKSAQYNECPLRDYKGFDKQSVCRDNNRLASIKNCQRVTKNENSKLLSYTKLDGIYSSMINLVSVKISHFWSSVTPKTTKNI